jgi:hypothetical protein
MIYACRRALLVAGIGSCVQTPPRTQCLRYWKVSTNEHPCRPAGEKVVVAAFSTAHAALAAPLDSVAAVTIGSTPPAIHAASAACVFWHDRAVKIDLPCDAGCRQ